MRRYALIISLGLIVGTTGCNDPKDPQTWIKQLRNPRKATKAVRMLRKLKNPVAIEPLCSLFKDFQSPNILKAIISFKNKKAIPCLVKALDFSPERYHNATLAANALAKFKAKSAVKPLVKILDTPLPLTSRANLAKLAAIKALGKIGDTSAVPGLIRVIDRRPEKQDFLLNKTAAQALGNLRDVKAIPSLIASLFMASTRQGSSYPMARVALVQIGEPAVQPLIQTYKRENKRIEALAKELKFRANVIENKTAMVLGAIRSKTALPFLLEELKKADIKSTKAAGVLEAIGRIGDPSSIPPLINLLKNKKANYKLRTQVCSALTVIGDKRAIPVLLEVAEKGYIKGGWMNLREAAVMAYARIVGAEIKTGMPKLKAMHDDPKLKKYKATQGVFKEAIDRAKVAEACGDDPVCYGKKANNSKLSLAQRSKAGLMIGILPGGRKALPALVKALPNREPVLRLLYLEAAKHIGKASDAKLIATLKKLVARDSKRSIKMLGADLASADKVTLAVILRKK